MHQYDLVSTQFGRGDFLVVPRFHGPPGLRASQAEPFREQTVASVPTELATWVRAMRLDPAGSHYRGGLHILPWSLSDQPLEAFAIYRAE